MSEVSVREEQIVQAMAESAHEAWMQWYVDHGYDSRKAVWGEEFLVPFGQLSEQGKELDRVIMRAILKALDKQGYTVAPKSGYRLRMRSDVEIA